jgi:outer membrane protein
MKLVHMFVIPLLCVFAVQTGAQVPTPLGLPEAVKAALESHPLMRSARLGVEEADYRSTEARTGRIPTLRVSEVATRSNNPVFVFGSLLEQGRFGPQNFALSSLNNPAAITNFRTVLSASVPVFDGMKTSARIAQSDIGSTQAARQEEIAAERVRFEVLSNYFAVSVAQAGFDVATEAVRMAESDVTRARNRLDAGLAVESDVLAAEVQLAEFKQQLIQAEGNLATTFTELNISIGSSIDARRVLSTPLAPKTFDISQPDLLIARALLHRSDYEQAQSGIELADKRVEERRGEYLPELNVFALMVSSGRNLTTGSSDYAVGASVTYDLFDRGRPARVGQAITGKRVAETERDRLADQIRREVVRAYHQFRAAEQQVDVAVEALGRATESLRIIQDRYEAGLTTITDVLRAETALVRTRMNVVVSRHDQYVGYANVLLSIGELDDVSAFEP